MKKFEEELKNGPVMIDKDNVNGTPIYDEVTLIGYFNDWISPEDYEKYIKESTDNTSKLLGKINDLKDQLEKQQSEILEVPSFVADWYEENKGSLDYMIFETCIDLTDESTNEFEKWFGYDENKAITTLVNMKNGYTVAKEKRFYLKHIDMSKKYNSTVCVLAHGEGDVIYGHYEFPVGVFPSESDYIFTQSQIDSMETGSYEQIEVEE